MQEKATNAEARINQATTLQIQEGPGKSARGRHCNQACQERSEEGRPITKQDQLEKRQEQEELEISGFQEAAV